MYIDWIAFLVAFLFLGLLLIIYSRNRLVQKPTIYVSNLDSFQIKDVGWRSRYYLLPSWLKNISLFLFIVAFIDPHLYVKREQISGMVFPPTEGIAIYLVLDKSGSMLQEVPASQSDASRIRISKIQLMRDVTKEFINKRNNDLIGLVSFARTANVLVPLTLNHQAVLDQLSKVDAVKNIDDDGTATGYAIYKTASLIAATRRYAEELVNKGEAPSYDIKNSIILVVTDGFPNPNEKDSGNAYRMMGVEQAAEYAKKEGVHVYVIVVDPALSSPEFAANKHQMQRITNLTGGQFYMVDDATSLSDIYKQIDQIEKSVLPSQLPRSQQPLIYSRFSFYPYLIALGLAFLLFSQLLETTVMRRFP